MTENQPCNLSEFVVFTLSIMIAVAPAGMLTTG